MTNGRINWEALTSKAREESAPSLDVSPLVAQKIASANPISVSACPTWSTTELSATGLSIAAALLMMLTVAMTGVSWDDPLGDWFSSLFLVMS